MGLIFSLAKWRLQYSQSLLLFIFSCFFFGEKHCQILTGLNPRLYLLPGYNPLRKNRNRVAWRETTNHSMSSSLSFPVKVGLEFDQKTVERVDLFRNIICSPALTPDAPFSAFSHFGSFTICFFLSKTCWRWSKLLPWKRRRLKTRNASCCASKEGSSLCCSVR